MAPGVDLIGRECMVMSNEMMVRFCRRCGGDRVVYDDVIANQRALRCGVCHRRVADGPLLAREERCLLLTSRELSSDTAGSEWEESILVLR